MTKLINMKGVVALAMALSFCVFSVVPNNSITPTTATIVSEPIMSYEVQDIKGGILPAIVVAAIAADAALIASMVALYAVLESTRQQTQAQRER
ncbi:MAG: hypothetical protein OXH81_11390 [Gemmatimonadetes bacterium]|nr:hypothetical protein [Gemmatimonadota bacterium]